MGGAGKGVKRQRNPLSLMELPYMTDRIEGLIALMLSYFGLIT